MSSLMGLVDVYGLYVTLIQENNKRKVMSSLILKLREIINNPHQLDSTKEWIPLGDEDSPFILVYGKALCFSIIKSTEVAPSNLLSYWKAITKAPVNSFPAMEAYFKLTPFSLHGQEHFVSRRALGPCYKRIEKELPNWISEFSENFFRAYKNNETISTSSLVADYINQFNREILAHELSIDSNDLPAMPGEMAHMITTYKLVEAYDQRLQILVNFIEKTLNNIGLDMSEAWSLVSITVMGTEGIAGALLYGLANKPNKTDIWQAEDLVNLSYPVTLLAREPLCDLNINGLSLKKGQRLYVSPALASMLTNVNADETPDIPFGMGVHICPGKRISLTVINAFFNAWSHAEALHPRISKVKFSRDFILRAKDIT